MQLSYLHEGENNKPMLLGKRKNKNFINKLDKKKMSLMKNPNSLILVSYKEKRKII